jgi:hypothetical protein
MQKLLLYFLSPAIHPEVEMGVGEVDIHNPTGLLAEITSKDLYRELVVVKFDRSKANRIYSKDFNLREEDWQNIYLLSHKIQVCNKAKEFQFTVLHRYLGTNKLLFKIG